MKFLILVKATPESEAGTPPSAELLSEMMKYNEELVKAGILLDLGGLQPSSQAVRIKIDGRSRKVEDASSPHSRSGRPQAFRTTGCLADADRETSRHRSRASDQARGLNSLVRGPVGARL